MLRLNSCLLLLLSFLIGFLLCLKLGLLLLVCLLFGFELCLGSILLVDDLLLFDSCEDGVVLVFLKLKINLLLESIRNLEFSGLLNGKLILESLFVIILDLDIGVMVLLKSFLGLLKLFLVLKESHLILVNSAIHLLFLLLKLGCLIVHFVCLVESKRLLFLLSLGESDKLVVISVFSTGILVVGNDSKLVELFLNLSLKLSLKFLNSLVAHEDRLIKIDIAVTLLELRLAMSGVLLLMMLLLNSSLLLLLILMLVELLDLLLKSRLSESLNLSLLLNGLFTLLVLGKGMLEILCLQLGFSVLHVVLHLLQFRSWH